MKRMLTILVAMIIVLNPNGVTGKNQERIFVSYSLSDVNEAFRFIKELKPNEELLPGNYNVNVKLSFKGEKKDVIFESLNFEPPEDNNYSNEQLPQSWTSLDKTYYWHPSGQENDLTIPLLPIATENNASITDFDELHIDYNDLNSENRSLLTLKMIVSWGKSGENQATVIIDGKQLVLLKSFNLSSALWKEKGISYLTKRMFGLAHDSSWNYIRRSNYVFYQNRFHLDLRAVETVDIHFKTNASLEKINSLTCNLRVGFESLLNHTKIEECAKFPKKIFRSNGNVVLRIWVGDLLHSKYKNKEKAFLDEILFRIPQNKLDNVLEQPVASIRFRSLYQPKIFSKNITNKDSGNLEMKDQVFHFQTPIVALFSKRKRLIFPLEKLTEKIGLNGKIKNIALSIQPEHWDSPAEFLLQRLRLVSHVSKEHPAILNAGKKISVRWGGPFIEQEENDEKIEWIKVLNFFSFTTPNINHERELTTSLEGERRGLHLNFSSAPIDLRGLQIHAPNGFHRWHADKDGLILEGKGNSVEIDWPLQTVFDRNTRFFMNFGEGRENILDLKIIPFTESREHSPISVSPNKPKRLKEKADEVKMLKIKISLHSSPFRLQIKEVAIFQPLLLKPSKILDTPTLIEGETLLVPKNVETRPQNIVTIVNSHISAPLMSQEEGILNELSWTTEVNKKVGRIQGLKVMYKVPSTMHVNNPCWLHFTLVSTHHEVRRSICSEDSTREIIFHAEKLFHGINFKKDEILKRISWKVSAKNQINLKNQLLPIDVAVSLIGYDIRTFRSDLLSHPVMEWNGTALFPTSMDGVSTEDIFPHKIFTSLGTVSVKGKPEPNPFFNLLDHPYFQIESINLEKEEPIPANDWISLTRKDPKKMAAPEASRGAYIPKLIFFSLLAGALWWGWRQKARISSLKWLIELSPQLAQKQIRVWLFIAAGHYLVGLIFSLIKWRTSAGIFLTLGSLPIFLAWRSFVWKIRPELESYSPELATLVFRGSGGPYIAGFLLTLMTAAFFLIVRLEWIAGQIAVVGYYMLVIGVLLEAKHLRNKNHEQNGEDEMITTGEGAPGA